MNRARIGIIDPSVPPVKLLRGTNVGGKNKLSMKDLAAMFGEAGCDDVWTLHPEWERSISSRSGAGRRHPVPDQCVNLEPLRLSRSSGRPHGPRAPGIEQANPFAEAGAEANKLLVLFLAELPDRAQVEALDPSRSPGDETCEERVYAWSPGSAASSLKDPATFSMFRLSPNALAPRER